MFWPGLTTRHPHFLSVGSSGTPLQRPQRPQEGDWDAEDRALIGFQQAPFSELPPPIHVLQESGLPDADPSQVGAGLEWHGPCTGLFGLPCPRLDLMVLLPFYTAPWCSQGRRASSCWDSTLSRRYSCPGLQPQHATTPGSALKHPALCIGQPALSPVDPAGDPSSSRLWYNTEPGASAHYASYSLRASCCNHQQLRRKGRHS